MTTILSKFPCYEILSESTSVKSYSRLPTHCNSKTNESESWNFVLFFHPSIKNVICNWYDITGTMSGLLIHRIRGFLLQEGTQPNAPTVVTRGKKEWMKYQQHTSNRASPMSQWVKNPPANAGTQETWVRPLGQEDLLEEEKWTTHSSVLAWRILWTEEPGGLQYKGSQRLERDWPIKHAYLK